MAEVQDMPATLSDAGPVATPTPSLPRGTTIHRYVLLDEVGAGAMGVVYAAYDYGLDRKVALKLVRDPGRSASHGRLLREAQALAQLSHPNVVAVFDVGTYRDQVYVAMEFVAGQTLRSWLTGSRRSWREVVEVYRRAGEGLAAAHAAGIVHRDFKPDNVLIDERGRVRVGDFGLAFIERDAAGADESEIAHGSGPFSPATSRASREGAQGSEQGSERGSDHADSRSRTPRLGSLTATGMAIGTPAYMAPEQQTGWLPIDARADQFSFCVSLHEALCGERPFGAEEAPDLAERIAEGAVRAPPRDRRVPAWLRRVLRRGLSYDQDSRYASMDALLADIDRELGARRRRRVAVAGAAGAGVLVFSALVAGAGLIQEEEQEPPCRGAAGKLAGVWDTAGREGIRNAFRAAGGAGAADDAARVEVALDRYARTWIASHTDSCEATHVRGEQSESLLDLRTQCLDERLAALRTLIDQFRRIESKGIRVAAQAVDSLEPLDLCDNAAALRDVVPPPSDPASRVRLDELRSRLTVVRALSGTGKYKQALEQGGKLVADARAFRYRPLEAEALAILGRIQRQNDKLPEAEETLYQAIAAGEAGRSGTSTVDAWLDLLWVVGVEQTRTEEGLRLARVARGAIERLGQSAKAEGKLEDAIGMMYVRAGKYDEARAPLERGLALLEKAHGREGAGVAAPLQHLADYEQLLSAQDKAVALYRRARENLEKSYGPDHPTVISLLGSEGASLYYMGRHDEALRLFELGLRAEERVRGPDTHTAGTYHKFIGLALWKKGDPAGARAALGRAVAVMEKLFGPDHNYVAPPLSSLGMVLADMKLRAEATATLRRALAIQERGLGKNHPDVALTLDRIATLQLDARKPEGAVGPLERALAIRERTKGDPRDLAVTRFHLAEALLTSERMRGRVKSLARIRSLARSAAAGLEAAGHAQEAATLRGWIAAHVDKKKTTKTTKKKRR
jgi:eukaryotic-like serine/threonine-protein kinase